MVGCLLAEPCKDIVKLRNQFLSCYDVKSIDFDSLINHLIVLSCEDRDEHLRSLLSNTVEHALAKKYPLKVSYSKCFIKSLLERVEKMDCHFSDLYEVYVELLQRRDENGFHFRHFYIGDDGDRVISVEESDSAISGGTTGLSIWQGGIALAQWCLKNAEILKGQSVIELGCGSGVTGLLCLSRCKTLSYHFTDCHTDVLRLIKSNLRLNYNQEDLASVSCLTLNWSEIEDCNSLSTPSIVLAADIVYDPQLFPHIYKTLKLLLTDQHSTAFLACTVRDENTLSQFINGLSKNDLFVVEQSEIKPETLYFSKEPPVVLLKIKSVIS